MFDEEKERNILPSTLWRLEDKLDELSAKLDELPAKLDEAVARVNLAATAARFETASTKFEDVISRATLVQDIKAEPHNTFTQQRRTGFWEAIAPTVATVLMAIVIGVFIAVMFFVIQDQDRSRREQIANTEESSYRSVIIPSPVKKEIPAYKGEDGAILPKPALQPTHNRKEKTQ